jgi:hypothetical protein
MTEAGAWCAVGEGRMKEERLTGRAVRWQELSLLRKGDGMSNPARTSRSALALALAAAIAFLGSLVMLDAGRVLARAGSGAAPDGRPGALLLAVVVLLGVTGVLLAALAASDLRARHQLHPARGAPRRRR